MGEKAARHRAMALGLDSKPAARPEAAPSRRRIAGRPAARRNPTAGSPIRFLALPGLQRTRRHAGLHRQPTPRRAALQARLVVRDRAPQPLRPDRRPARSSRPAGRGTPARASQSRAAPEPRSAQLDHRAARAARLGPRAKPAGEAAAAVRARRRKRLTRAPRPRTLAPRWARSGPGTRVPGPVFRRRDRAARIQAGRRWFRPAVLSRRILRRSASLNFTSSST